MRTTHRTQLLLPLGIVFLVAYSMAIFFQQQQPLLAGASDFSSFYAAGRLVDTGHRSQVYDRAAQGQIQAELFDTLARRKGPLPFIHAPFELLIFAPLALLSYSHAVLVWFICNLVLLILVPLILMKRLPVLRSTILIALLAVAFFIPANIALLQGQDSILLLLIFTLAFADLSRGRETRAGCILALATFKPQLVLPVLLVMAIARKWKVLISFLGTGLALLGISIALVGWRTVLAFPHFLVEFNRLPPAVAGAYPDTMPNLRGLMYGVLSSAISPEAMQLIIIGLSVFLMLLVTVACLADKRGISDINFALLVMAALLVAYHLNGHDLVLLILPIFIVANHVAGRELTPTRMVLGIMAGVLFILPGLLPPPQFIAAAALLFLIALLIEGRYPNAVAPVHRLAELRHGLE